MKECCILINSCSLYFGLIEPYMILLRKYWSDCNFPIYVNMDCNMPENNLNIKYNFQYIISDLLPKGENILNRLIYSLDILRKQYKYVINVLDDSFIFREMNNDNFNKCIDFIKENTNIGAIRLHSSLNSSGKEFYKPMSFTSYYEKNNPDYICGCCIDKLYKKKYDLPHIEAHFKDKNIKPLHTKRTSLDLGISKFLCFAPSLWEIDYLYKGLYKLIYSKNKELLTLKKKGKYVNDHSFFEVFGSKYKNKFDLLTDKLIVAPMKLENFIWQSRCFCGSGIYRGWAIRWLREGFLENNIKIKFYDGYFIKKNKNSKETSQDYSISIKDEIKICLGNNSKKY